MTNQNQNFNSNLPSIIKVEFNGKQTFSINSWELFQKLENKNYSAWCHNILSDGDEGSDFIFANNTGVNRKRGRERKEYLFSLDFAKHIVLLSHTDFGNLNCLKRIMKEVLMKKPHVYHYVPFCIISKNLWVI